MLLDTFRGGVGGVAVIGSSARGGSIATTRNRVRKSRRIGIIKKIVAIITGS
jgi:hypothetical protein